MSADSITLGGQWLVTDESLDRVYSPSMSVCIDSRLPGFCRGHLCYRAPYGTVVNVSFFGESPEKAKQAADRMAMDLLATFGEVAW